jgi:WD40 repeat protein/serine/threonine protein kinase
LKGDRDNADMNDNSSPPDDLTQTFKTLPTCVFDYASEEVETTGMGIAGSETGKTAPPLPADPDSTAPEIPAAVDPPERSAETTSAIDPTVAAPPRAKKPAAPQPPPSRSTRMMIRRCTIASGVGAATGTLEYALKDKIGEGGSGVVFTAYQNTVDREVAVKVIRPEMAQNTQVKSQFLSEAVLTGDLDHPNIVPVYDLGVDQRDCLFYAMKKIKGVPWKKVIAHKSEVENIEILLRVCDAIAFSHAKGVIHRDLKPHNIMLGDYGEVFVMDWGIAVSPTGNTKAEILTPQSNQAGTPAYMAPEMVEVNAARVNHLSDIYLLGGLLYEIETGLAPHAGGNLQECLKRVAENVIQPTQKKSELIDIALKAMSTQPSQRYQRVAEFSQAIRGYQSHAQSIALCKSAAETHARARRTCSYQDFLMALFSYENALSIWPANPQAMAAKAEVNLGYAAAAFENKDYDLTLSLLDAENEAHLELLAKANAARKERQLHQKHMKWLKRGSLTLALVTLITVTVGLIAVKFEKDRAVSAEQKMRIAQTEALQEYYYSAIALAARKLHDQQFEQALALLNKLPEIMRGWEWGRLMRLCRLDLLSFRGHDRAIAAVAFSPDEKRIATADRGNIIKIWNTSDGREVATFAEPTSNGKIVDLHFSIDGRRLIAPMSDGFILKCDIDKGAVTREASPTGESEAYIFYSLDRKYFITRTLDSATQVRRTKDNQTVQLLQGHTDSIYAAAFSPDGTKVATGAGDKTAILWDMKTGAPLITFKGHGGSVQAVKFSPSGRYLLTGGADRIVKLWSTEENRDQKLFLGHRSFVSTVTFSADSRRMATGSHDGTIKIWEVAGHREIRTLNAGIGRVNAVRFSPDGRWLIGGGAANQAHIWAVDSGEVVATLKGHDHAIAAVDFSTDGRWAATGSWDRTVKIWNLKTFQVQSTVKGHQGAVIAVRFAPDGRHLVSGGKDHVARIWDVASGETIRELRDHSASVYAVAYTPDGGSIASASWDKTIKIWDAASGRVLRTLSGHTASIYDAAFIDDGKRLISAGWDKSVKVWDTQSGQELMELSVQSAPLYAVAISSDGLLAAAGGRDFSTTIWQAERYTPSQPSPTQGR